MRTETWFCPHGAGASLLYRPSPETISSRLVWFVTSTFEGAEVVFVSPFGDVLSHFTARLVGKTEMDTKENAGVDNFLCGLGEACVISCIHNCRARVGGRHGEAHAVGFEEMLHREHRRARNSVSTRRVVRIRGVEDERFPRTIAYRIWISVHRAVLDRGLRPPIEVMEFGVPHRDYRVCLNHRHESK